LKKQENELVKGLSKRLGVDEEILRGYMKQERYLNEQEIKSLNIAQIVTNRELKAVAKIKLDMNNEEMKKELSGISKLLSEIKAMFSKNDTKALVIQDVEGNEIDFPDIETEEQIQTELTANIDGAPANGEYVLEDGRTLKFESGTLIEIMEAEGGGESELEVLKKELETLRAEKESAEALVKQKDEDHNALQKEFNDFKANSNTKLEKVEKEFTKFKAKFSKDFTPQGGPEGEGNKKITRQAFKRKEN